MPDQYEQERSVTDRRANAGCGVHEERMDKIDQQISSNHGWLKGVSTLVLVVGFVLSSLCTVIIGRLGNITDMLTDYRVMLKTHEIEINGLKGDVTELKAWAVNHDQNRRERN
jgi:hypothetical protein